MNNRAAFIYCWNVFKESCPYYTWKDWLILIPGLLFIIIAWNIIYFYDYCLDKIIDYGDKRGWDSD